MHISNLNFQILEDLSATSSETLLHSKDNPGILRFEDATSNSLLLRWNWLNPQSEPTKIYIQYRQVFFLSLIFKFFNKNFNLKIQIYIKKI